MTTSNPMDAKRAARAEPAGPVPPRIPIRIPKQCHIMAENILLKRMNDHGGGVDGCLASMLRTSLTVWVFLMGNE